MAFVLQSNAEIVAKDEVNNSTAVSSLTDDGGSSSSPRKKPPHSCIMLEVLPLTRMPEKHLLVKCPECEADMTVSFPTLCLATSTRLECSNKGNCTHVALEKPETTDDVFVDETDQLRTQNSDFALNVLFVLSFTASGDGGTEAEHLCGLLGLLNSTTMKSRSFGNIKNQNQSNHSSLVK